MSRLDDDFPRQAARIRNSLDQAGLAADRLTFGADGKLFIPDEALRFADPAIANVAKAKSDDISQVAASQLDISKQYYEGVLAQGRQSFRWAVAAAATGLAFFIAGVGFALVSNKINAAIISALGGGVVEVISGLNFWLYTKAAGQLDEFHVRLERMQRFLLANSVAQTLAEPERTTAVASLAQTIQVSPIERANVLT
jgi:hypothetical protein